MAFFVFLAGAAEAGVVAADFGSGAALRGGVCCGGASGLFGGGEVALLVALELALQGVDGGAGRARGDGGWWGLLLWLSIDGLSGETWLRVIEGAFDGRALLRGGRGGCEVQAGEVFEAFDGRAVGS